MMNVMRESMAWTDWTESVMKMTKSKIANARKSVFIFVSICIRNRTHRSRVSEYVEDVKYRQL